jgi:hypothetical protein
MGVRPPEPHVSTIRSCENCRWCNLASGLARRETARGVHEILVYRAGMIGTIYAARLRQSGHLVTLLARGSATRGHPPPRAGARRRCERASIDHPLRYRATCPRRPIRCRLIAVRRDQLVSVMPALQANRSIQTMFFTLNNPVGSSDLVRALGQDRVLLGFPGGGGDAGWTHCPLRVDLAAADDARRIERSKDRARAEPSALVKSGGISDHNIGRHGCMAEGPRLPPSAARFTWLRATADVYPKTSLP